MKGLNKIFTVFLIFCFFINSISFAAEINLNWSTLAAPSNLSSEEFRHLAIIEAGVRFSLKGIPEINPDSLKRLGAKELARESVFRPKIDGSLLFNQTEEVQIEEDHYYVFKAVVDGFEYSCLINKADNKISVVPYRTYIRSKEENKVRVIYDTLNPESRAILDSYIEHEITTGINEAIDTWIARNMKAGNYAVSKEIVDANPLYKHPDAKNYNAKQLRSLLEGIWSFLNAVGVRKIDKIISELSRKPLVLIPYVDESHLPFYAVSGEEVKATAHSSPFATYVFVPRYIYNELETIGKKWSDAAISYIEHEIIHEIGAICALKVKVEDGSISNILDGLFIKYKEANRPSKMVVDDIIKEDIESLAPVDLLKLELRTDYASGKTVEKKSIFKRVMFLLLGTVGIGTGAIQGDVVNLAAPMTIERSIDSKTHVNLQVESNSGASMQFQSTLYVSGHVKQTNVEFECYYDPQSTVLELSGPVSPWETHIAIYKYNRYTGEISTIIADTDIEIVYERGEGELPIDYWRAINDMRQMINNMMTELEEEEQLSLLESALNMLPILPVSEEIGQNNHEKAVQPSKDPNHAVAEQTATDDYIMSRIAESLSQVRTERRYSDNGQILNYSSCYYDWDGAEIQHMASIGDAIPAEGVTIPKIWSAEPVYGPMSSSEVKVAPWGIEVKLVAGIKNKIGRAGGKQICTADVANLSGLANITFGVKGDFRHLVVELVDIQGASVEIYVGGVKPEIVRWVSIPTSLIRQLNPRFQLDNIRNILYMAEEKGMSGTLSIHAYPEFEPSAKCTQADVNLPMLDQNDGYKVAMQCEAATISNGLHIDYPADEGGWSAGGIAYNYDPWVFPRSTRDFTLLSDGAIVVGIKSTASTIKMEFNDINDQRADVYLKNVTPDRYQFYRIPLATLKGVHGFKPAFDPSQIRAVVFAIEREVKAGTVDIMADMTSQQDIASSTPEEKAIGALWEAGRRDIPEEEARRRLEALVPDVAHDSKTRDSIYRKWIEFAKSILFSLSLAIRGKYTMPAREDIEALATTIIPRGIEIFMPSSQFPKNATAKFKDKLQEVFGERLRLRIYTKIEDLEAMVKNPEQSVIMTTKLQESDVEKLKDINSRVRLLNFGEADVESMSETEHENYMAEMISILIAARSITDRDDKTTAIYRFLASLLEDYMEEGMDIDVYINNITNSTLGIIDKLKYLLKNILKALPIRANDYKNMKPAVEIFWSV